MQAENKKLAEPLKKAKEELHRLKVSLSPIFHFHKRYFFCIQIQWSQNHPT